MPCYADCPAADSQYVSFWPPFHYYYDSTSTPFIDAPPGYFYHHPYGQYAPYTALSHPPQSPPALASPLYTCYPSAPSAVCDNEWQKDKSRIKSIPGNFIKSILKKPRSPSGCDANACLCPSTWRYQPGRLATAYTTIKVLFQDSSDSGAVQKASFLSQLLSGETTSTYAFQDLKVDDGWTVKRFIDTLTHGEAEKRQKDGKKVGLSQVGEKGDNKWSRRGTLAYADDKKMSRTLKDIDWDAATTAMTNGGGSGKIVWCVVHDLPLAEQVESAKKNTDKAERDVWGF